ncbi:MAG: helix-turn-helix domain-containing protein [Acholeplasmataceae bacterium]
MHNTTLLFPNLRYQMKLQGYSIQEMSKKICIHENTLRNKLNGNSSFTLEEAQKISVVLNQSSDYLFKKID